MVDIEAQTRATPALESPAPTIFKRANRPVTLKFDDVVYKVKPSKGRKLLRCTPNTKSCGEISILKGLSGVVRPGEVLAMLGPSGCGKTTLLTALGGRLLTEGQLSGTITYNDKPFSNTIKRTTGFVPQIDVFLPHLTVSETLVFAALLRMPNTFSRAEKIAIAEDVISQLGLTKCKNSVVGGPFTRGISGGERKRVSIGQELLINPSLLLLDEPTSGLDSTTAQRTVSAVAELASTGGRTVLMSIHQPSSRLFYMFDKLILLSEGNSLYFGNGSDVMDYFSSIGYAPSMAMNPSDFLLDLANGLLTDGAHDRDQATVLKQRLVLAYNLNLSEKVKADILVVQETNRTQLHLDFGLEDKNFGQWPTTWWQEFSVLFRRGVKERRHLNFSGLKIGQVLFVSILCGLLWWQSDISQLQDQTGLLFYIALFWGFLPVSQATFTFPAERKILTKERESGMYRLSSYFLARSAGDLPMELVLPFTFVTITYWMAGLKPTANNFLLTVLVILLSVLVSQGLGLALGALFMTPRSATTIGAVITMSFFLAAGFYVQNVPRFISWLKYISSSYHTYKLLLGTQYKNNETYPCENRSTGGLGLCLVGDNPSISKVGLDGQALSAFALVLMLVIFRLIAYISLMRIGVTKD
ncbi:ABC transporter G family member 9-like [Humulus lupulus]|uniref:ABC transporter G family member 9-like n=1 Tax=Humulus lupulus TaxID=3486 RepID=UPI002B406B6F|nr:ABC transporter G family member 9-like [Humulus lupulus]